MENFVIESFYMTFIIYIIVDYILITNLMN